MSPVPELEFSPDVHAAFTTFLSTPNSFALALSLQDNVLTASPIISSEPDYTAQQNLNLLTPILSSKTALYLLLRHDSDVLAITFIPYFAAEAERNILLSSRHELVKELGVEHFAYQLICKELGEIVDVRTWQERKLSRDSGQRSSEEVLDKISVEEESGVRDLGYARNKCRLCDRRMQNRIADDALDALRGVKHVAGGVVQIRVDTATESLILICSQTHHNPNTLSTLIPSTYPTFTFFHHPASRLMYFISHCPDSAPVTQRMMHTMAIPGLLVHAEDVGVDVDKKREIHDTEDFTFESAVSSELGAEGEGKTSGKYRSMYERKGFQGTELVYSNLESDKAVVEARG